MRTSSIKKISLLDGSRPNSSFVSAIIIPRERAYVRAWEVWGLSLLILEGAWWKGGEVRRGEEGECIPYRKSPG